MFGLNNHLAEQLKAKKHENAMLDGIKEAAEQITFDPINERKAVVDIGNMRMAALSIVLNTVHIVSETDVNDPESLLPNEVLDSLILEALDLDEESDNEDGDGRLRATLSAHIADAFISLGCDEQIIEDVFGDDFEVADTAIEDAVQTVLDNLPDDGEPLDEFADEFAFGYPDDGEEDEEEQLDALVAGKKTTKTFGGKKVRYQAVKAIKNGKLVVKNKRIGGGKIKLSAKQKAAIRKMQKKAHIPGAYKSRIRSLKKGVQLGIYKPGAERMIGVAQKGHKKAWAKAK